MEALASKLPVQSLAVPRLTSRLMTQALREAGITSCVSTASATSKRAPNQPFVGEGPLNMLSEKSHRLDLK